MARRKTWISAIESMRWYHEEHIAILDNELKRGDRVPGQGERRRARDQHKQALAKIGELEFDGPTDPNKE